jgi:hypothetical protein
MIDPLREPARIAFCGDWHMNGRWAAYAIGHAAALGAEMIIHLGDFGFTFTASFMHQVDTALAEADLPLLFVDGNHDDHEMLADYPIGENGLRRLADRVWHLPRGFRWQWAGVRYLALGGAHSVDRRWRTPGLDWWAGETIGRGDIARVLAGGPADVLVSHDCPAGVVIPGIDDRLHPPPFPVEELRASDEHRSLLRSTLDPVQPRAIWHGHYHVRYSVTADLGYGPVAVTGLDCDGSSLDRNVQIFSPERAG